MEKTPQERRQEKTRQAILTAALQIISEKGADKLSLREIARRIDYSPAGLYEYFGSKDEIINAACGEADERLFASLNAVPKDLPIEQRLIEIGMAYIRFAREYPEQFVFLFINSEIGADVTVHDMEQLDPNSSFSILYGTVLTGIEQGDIQVPQGINALDVAYELWSVVHGTAMLQVRYLRQFPYDFERADRHMVETFVRALVPRRGR